MITGVSDDTYIEITSGLQDGDTITYIQTSSSNSGNEGMNGMGGMGGMGGMPGKRAALPEPAEEGSK